MLFERIVSEGLAHNSYMIGDAGTAAVIDPRRDGDIYLEIAARNSCIWWIALCRSDSTDPL